MACLVISTIEGGSLNFVYHMSDSGAFFDYVVRPLIAMVIFGFGPAVALGFFYSALMRTSVS